MTESLTETNLGANAQDSALGQIETQTTEAVGENRRQLSETLSKIAEDQDLSESAKDRFREEASRKASERHSEIVSSYESATKEALAESEQAVFRLSFPADAITDSQKEMYRASYRDCLLKCLNLSESELDTVMSIAERTGDHLLAQSAYHVSVQKGIFSVAEAYRSANPTAAQAWQKYTETRLGAESNEALLGRALLSTSNPSA
jgi:hypothetical protein